jgi:uncharacterized protein YaeQ
MDRTDEARSQDRPRDIIGRMALSSTIFVVDVDLADADRNVYETLSLRLARHPSESDEFLVARLLAYCLEHTEGIEFSRGLCDADEPPVAVRDLTGRLTEACRTSKASRTCTCSGSSIVWTGTI